jgi:Mrp family chromosome partitioning ATPase
MTYLWQRGSERTHVVRVGPNGQVRESYFRSEAFRRSIEELRQTFDFIVIDSPPLVPMIDPIAIAELADGLVIVVTPRTSERLLQQAARRLRHMATPVLGYVANRTAEDIDLYGYGYQATSQPETSAEADGEPVGAATVPGADDGAGGDRPVTRSTSRLARVTTVLRPQPPMGPPPPQGDDLAVEEAVVVSEEQRPSVGPAGVAEQR